eukprot:TRINITY_DN4109_c0_g1_i4.p1 TRINITY_DN4109_c0_g1~~TRINITY_DN4109_c0_g1_i4.p1  ORF type:complete len:109 (-),score=4.88 TRINITY_DN4109_c0_g1_i4:252-557(-)
MDPSSSAAPPPEGWLHKTVRQTHERMSTLLARPLSELKSVKARTDATLHDISYYLSSRVPVEQIKERTGQIARVGPGALVVIGCTTGPLLMLRRCRSIYLI